MGTPLENHERRCKEFVARWKKECNLVAASLKKEGQEQYSVCQIVASSADYEGWYIRYLESVIFLAGQEARMAQDAMGWDLKKLIDILS